MKKNKKILSFKRKYQGKTNYHKRLKLLSSPSPRLVVRVGNRSVQAQLISFHAKGDKTLCSSHSKDLKKYGWDFHAGNIPSAYLTGYILGLKAKKQKIEKAILDIGFRANTKYSAVYGALKGALDAGLDIPHANDVFPPEEKITGKHIADYATLSKNKNQFLEYKKKNIDLSTIAGVFEKIKEKISKEAI